MPLDASTLPDQLLGLAKGRLAANPSSAALAARVMALADARCGGTYPLIVGISGSQGSGKSTLAELIRLGLEQLAGRRVAVLSLDDFYLTRAERLSLSETVHRLCATRGAPGTHDVVLMLECISRLLVADQDETVRWPRFDKLADDRASETEWHAQTGRPDVILIEGWCVGLPANRVEPWQGPINALEAESDPDGRWLAWSLDNLRSHYAVLWKLLDLLIGIRLPDIATVVASRLRQEQCLLSEKGAARQGMGETQVLRFVQHYERLTRSLWAALPDIAEVLADRDADFSYRQILKDQP